MAVFNFALRFTCERDGEVNPIPVRITQPYATIEEALKAARKHAAEVKAGLEAPRWLGLVPSDIRVKRIDVAILDEAGVILRPFSAI